MQRKNSVLTQAAVILFSRFHYRPSQYLLTWLLPVSAHQAAGRDTGAHTWLCGRMAWALAFPAPRSRVAPEVLSAYLVNN